MSQYLHIISFDVPWPPNYGGIIAVFHQIRALYRKDIGIILHCFQYGDRQQARALEQYCAQVHYYPRRRWLSDHFSLKPFIVKTRQSRRLLKRLLKDDFPILFEGIHTCAF